MPVARRASGRFAAATGDVKDVDGADYGFWHRPGLHVRPWRSRRHVEIDREWAALVIARA